MLPDRRREETGSLLAASGPLVERIHLVVMRRHRHATATLSRRHPERARDSQPCPGREEMRRTGRHPDLLRAGTAVLLGADAGIPAGTVSCIARIPHHPARAILVSTQRLFARHSQLRCAPQTGAALARVGSANSQSARAEHAYQRYAVTYRDAHTLDARRTSFYGSGQAGSPVGESSSRTVRSSVGKSCRRWRRRRYTATPACSHAAAMPRLCVTTATMSAC